ncbi:F-box domain protein [Aspergillus luchuensis]|uniref:F-box domain protein n=1 Tax=Aspergillus kawachii TaxID=1069201 RepID=A0A146FNS2_ASPKA|nr:F-box domain protein [Aspergillus luchuensis]
MLAAIIDITAITKDTMFTVDISITVDAFDIAAVVGNGGQVCPLLNLHRQ